MMAAAAPSRWSGLRGAAARVLPAAVWSARLVLVGISIVLAADDATAQQPAIPVHAQVLDIDPLEVAKGVSEGRYLLVDVRESDEVAAEAYPHGVTLPLSRFDPKLVSVLPGQQVVFACRSGRRSVTASLAAQAAGFGYNKHLAGGILAWKAAGLSTKRGP